MYEQESKAVLHSLARLGIGSDLVWVFAVVTLVSSLAVLSLLPGLTGPALVVFIPTAAAAALVRLEAGRGQVTNLLFTNRAWRVTLKWTVISLGLALVLRLVVSGAGWLVIPGYEFRPGALTPLLLGIFVLPPARRSDGGASLYPLCWPGGTVR